MTLADLKAQLATLTSADQSVVTDILQPSRQFEEEEEEYDDGEEQGSAGRGREDDVVASGPSVSAARERGCQKPRPQQGHSNVARGDSGRGSNGHGHHQSRVPVELWNDSPGKSRQDALCTTPTILADRTRAPTTIVRLQTQNQAANPASPGITELWPPRSFGPSPPASPPPERHWKYGTSPPTHSVMSPTKVRAKSRSKRESQAAIEFARKMRIAVKKSAMEDLNKGAVWSFKYYHLFPAVQRMRHLDHLSRVVFPLAYLVVVVIFGAGVNWGNDSPLAGAIGSGLYPCLDKKQQMLSDGSFKLGFAGF